LKTLLVIITVFFASFAFCQKLDSVGIEKTISGSIGDIQQIDSLEKALLKQVEGNYTLEDTYHYNLSKARFLSGQLDAAFASAQKGIDLSLKENKTFRTAKFHNLQASVYAYKKDYNKAIQSFKISLAILEKEKDFYSAAQVENNIANIFFGLSDFESAYKYSKKSYDQLLKENDTVHLPGVIGIVAISALKLDRIMEGRVLANEALKLSTKYRNPIGLIVSNHSLGELYIVEKKHDTAIFYFNESLKLSELYQQSHFVMLNKVGLLHANLMAKNYQASVEFGEQALRETLELNNENTLYAIHKNLGYAFNGLGQSDQAFYHLSNAHKIYLASSGVQNQKAINDILIKYDTEKKERKLTLSRLQNVKDENTLYKRAQWIITLSALLILVLISYYFYNRLHKQKIQQIHREQESKRMIAAVLAEERERERISNELHDGMASSITGIKLKLEDLSLGDTASPLEPLVNQLQTLHDETRRISHNLMPLGLNQDNLPERLADYCRENSREKFKIQFSNNLRNTISLTPSESTLLYRSIQELIHNVQKHAESPSCIVQVSQLENELVLSVEDEGVGFLPEEVKGQGLESMRQRLKEIKADMEIESKIGEGSLISISLSIAS